MRRIRNRALRTRTTRPLLLACALGILWAGCTREPEVRVSDVSGADEVIVVGVARDLPPYSFQDRSGRLRGLTIDLTEAVAEVQGLRVELRTGTVAELREALASGAVDLLPHAPYSSALDERFALSLPHTDVADGLFVRAEEGPASLPSGSFLLDWLSQREVIVLADDPSLEFVRSVLDLEPRVEPSPADALRALAAGEGSCALLPARTGVLLSRDLGLSNVRILPTVIDGYSRGLAFATRADDTALLERFDDGMVILTETGRYLEIYNRWADAGDEQAPLRQILALLLAAVVALLVVSTVWSWQLRREVARRTEELRETVTERQRAELALAASEEKYRGLFDSSRDAIAFFDLDGAFVDVNPACVALLETSLDDLLLTTLEDWAPERFKPLAVELACRSSNGEAGLAHEIELVRGDGTRFPVLIRTWRVHDAAERPIGAWGILHDLTAQRQAEEETRRLERQIQQTQKLESLGVLAGGVAHDFNNLLTGILGHTSLALQGVERSSALGERLLDIQSSGQRAAELCRQMLAYSGRGRLELERIDLAELVREMRHLLVASIDSRVELELVCAAGLPPVEGDRSQLRQVVLNLVSNASDACEGKAGVVSIRCHEQTCDRGELAANVLGDRLEPGRYQILEVSDTGVGMSEETAARIFEPFFSTKFTGRGLGLAATLGIVRAHRGAVEVESQVGLGTTLRVILPFAESETTASSDTLANTALVVGGI